MGVDSRNHPFAPGLPPERVMRYRHATAAPASSARPLMPHNLTDAAQLNDIVQLNECGATQEIEI